MSTPQVCVSTPPIPKADNNRGPQELMWGIVGLVIVEHCLVGS